MISISPEIYVAEDLPVLYIKPLDSVVLSDVHIGYEEDMATKGIFIPKIQKKRFLTIYKRALKIFKTNKLIVNGDFKHSFSKLSKQEKAELTEILTQIKEEGIELKIVRGNHDNYISTVSDKFDNIELVEEINYDKIVIFHGHRDIEVKPEFIYIIGHEHPRLSIKDKLGFSHKIQCFLKMPLSNNSTVIILPATGIYQSGNDISLIHTNYMSPIIRKNGILEKARPYGVIEGQGIMEFPELGLLKDLIV
ncbi:metallophosphoesterase [Stygiolobus caldivivus]|uniref:Phosphoesterase n=1 Tax=Stygiolobus caldivivus TaxID=2824673 RepID=A0A8D5U8G9_9CREN|nr:metallophosphoesterase [Stygiolobus caldivivus]BCU71157.1 phosphoesterase [Stygiolobus caldivivus]